MTRATLLNRLLADGVIERVAVNRYRINGSGLQREWGLLVGSVITREIADTLFFYHTGTGNADYRLRTSMEAQVLRLRYPVLFQVATVPEPPRVPRRITRHSYHSNGGGTSRTGLQEALRAISQDADGVRRSFGLEWEIYALNSTQEDKLARLLDTMPAHVTERDGSLSPTGVEIVFLPVGREKYIEIFSKLQEFCRENNVDMNNTGAHTTYGVSNATCEVSDLQIRLNRIALSVKATSTQQAIKRVFGRDFTGYAALPTSTTVQSHSNAWSASRGTAAYELRLCNWQANPTKVAEFMVATEFIFNRTFIAQDFINIFQIMGSDIAGA